MLEHVFLKNFQHILREILEFLSNSISQNKLELHLKECYNLKVAIKLEVDHTNCIRLRTLR